MRHAIAPLLLLAAGLSACAAPGARVAAPIAQAAVAARGVHAGSLRAAEGFQTLDGQAASLDSYLGRPVLVAYLTPANGDSQAEVPLLLRLAAAYAGQGLAVVGVGEAADAQALRAFRASAGISFALWQDPAGGEFARRGLHGIPAFEFIDRQGQTASQHEGFASRGELTAGIESLLATR